MSRYAKNDVGHTLRYRILNDAILQFPTYYKMTLQTSA
jgi:hypothetical protein